MYRGTDYLVFLMRGGRFLPWYVFTLMDLATAVIVSMLWSSVMRQVFAKREHADDNEKSTQTPSS